MYQDQNYQDRTKQSGVQDHARQSGLEQTHQMPSQGLVKTPQNHHQKGDLEIIKQGYGISSAIKEDIIKTFEQSHKQTEYKNSADYLKHQLDQKYGPFWFVFTWEDKQHHIVQYSYYNNDDKVLEFKLGGWQVLIYCFNLNLQNQQQQPRTPYNQDNRNYPQQPQEDLYPPRDDIYRPLQRSQAFQKPDPYQQQGFQRDLYTSQEQLNYPYERRIQPQQQNQQYLQPRTGAQSYLDQRQDQYQQQPQLRPESLNQQRSRVQPTRYQSQFLQSEPRRYYQ